VSVCVCVQLSPLRQDTVDPDII